ncbi:Ni/Fe-hydrogenase 1 B-type cytochrome subunit [Malonomonas rubra DSM 5091]|uniref:Ni/Fe-hydrogenase 1 B-type cytochrome subunit n=1 Tax=Malonomonas rubra DSM 5091 TaxID=1122189 RepID=A0A1M6JXA7_MALRU|nr:Ni/Fe-hydrogenase, b-type cytochrome subunit [Malonomonas rubra]SHJ51302.1 Ni/Fe-hydrogenase 1 B-type cytochrome subunit [Malonomonas rubra DSM 5091]
MLQIRYVWELPVRITHWVNALCVLVLSVTGYYIGNPFYTAGSSAEYIMGWNRFIHFLFGYILLVSMMARAYWFLVGNQHSSWRMFFPWATSEGRKNALTFFRYYTFTGPKLPYEVGHNPLACMAYASVFTLFAVQIVSGFTLYGQFQPDSFWFAIFGWLPPLIDLQTLRLAHHVVMWLLIGFFINHLYSAWLMDVKEMNGVMSSIFSGYKFVEKDDL